MAPQSVRRSRLRSTRWRGMPNQMSAIIAGTTLLRSDASTVGRLIGLGTFLVVGTIMVATPVVCTYVAPTWSGRRMDAVFDWTLRHRRILLTVIRHL